MAWLQLTLSGGAKALVNTDNVMRIEEELPSKGSVIPVGAGELRRIPTWPREVLADHDRTGVGIARDQCRHDRTIDDAPAPQTANPNRAQLAGPVCASRSRRDRRGFLRLGRNADLADGRCRGGSLASAHFMRLCLMFTASREAELSSRLSAHRKALLSASTDVDPTRLGLFSLGQSQRQDSILHLGLDPPLVDSIGREAERPAIMPNIVFGVHRLELLVFREVDAAGDAQHVVFKADIDIRLVNPGHLHDRGQRIVDLEDVGRRHEGSRRDRRFALPLQLALLLRLPCSVAITVTPPFDFLSVFPLLRRS